MYSADICPHPRKLWIICQGGTKLPCSYLYLHALLAALATCTFASAPYSPTSTTRATREGTSARQHGVENGKDGTQTTVPRNHDHDRITTTAQSRLPTPPSHQLHSSKLPRTQHMYYIIYPSPFSRATSKPAAAIPRPIHTPRSPSRGSENHPTTLQRRYRRRSRHQ